MDTAKKYDPWIYQGQSLKVLIHIMINTLSKFNPYQVKNDKQLTHFHIISFNNKHGQHVTNIKTDNDTCRQSLWPVRVINDNILWGRIVHDIHVLQLLFCRSIILHKSVQLIWGLSSRR